MKFVIILYHTDGLCGNPQLLNLVVVMKKIRALLALFLCLAILMALPVMAADGTGTDVPEGSTQTEGGQERAGTDETEQASALPDYQAKAKAALLIDLNTGRTIFEQNADGQVYPASLTKIMTCLLALENGNLSDIVTITDNAYADVSASGSTAGLQVGEQLTLENLLYCMMVESGNEAANAVAEHVGGTIEDFVQMMNERAYALGCTHTHFMNPHGLHDESHYTTARDLSLIVEAALKSENFRTITNTAEYTLPATNLSEERVLKTTNMLIFQNAGNRYYYSKAIGIKTGYTTPAGRCVISSAKDNGMYLLGIICGAETTVLETGDIQMESFPECIRLFQYGFENFSYVSVLSPLYPVAQVAVTNSAGAEAVAVAPKDDIQILLPNGYDESKLDVEISLTSESVEAPVQESQVMGHATVSYDGELLQETDLLAIADVARSEISAMKTDTAAYMQRNWWKWIVLLIVIVVAIFAALYLWASIRRRIRRRQRIEQRRNALRERQRQARQIDAWEEDER